jgi:DNA-binding MarR family transcriptional regulator
MAGSDDANQSVRDDIMETIIASSESIHRLWRAHFFAMLHKLDDSAVTPSQLMALRSVHQHQPINSRQLGALLHVTPGAVTQLIDGLAAEDYIVRQQDDTDRRSTKLCLSDKAKALIAVVDTERKAMFMEVFGTMSEAELSAMAAIQEKMLLQLNQLQEKENV